MTSETWSKVRRLVEGALALPEGERTAWLAAQADEVEVRREAEHLLLFEHEASGIFALEMPSWDVPVPSVETDLAGATIGRYRLVEEIGRGGMGAVYLAERSDGTFEQRAAVKILQESIFTGKLAKRFAEERQILARLTHPGIARLLDGGVTPDGRPYLVLEYIDGRTIDRYCADEKLGTDAKLRLFLKVAAAVQSAHQQLVLHLDIKPANILVTADGEPKLLDFGISRVLSEGLEGANLAETTMRLLTPKYSSPEQAAGLPLGVGSDVFSLATLLYRLLTGRLPYNIGDVPALEAARMIREEAPIAPSKAASGAAADQLRGDLDNILLQALRKEPPRRYGTVVEFADDIRRYLAHQPVRAHADTFSYRAGKFLRRNRAAVIAAGVVMVVLAGSGVAVVRSAIIARQERATAERRLKDTRFITKSYINEVIPALENVPGTLDVRKKMVGNAVTYLTAMSKERSDDPTLDAELATGFYYLAQLQGNPYKPNLGNRAAALTSFEGGLAIERRSLARQPDDIPNIARVSLVLHGMAQLKDAEGDIPAGIKLNTEAWNNAQRVRREGSKNPRFNQIANIGYGEAMEYCYDGVWSMADPQKSLEWITQAEQVLEEYASAKPEIRTTTHYLGIHGYLEQVEAGDLIKLGHGEEARALYERGLQVLDSTPPKDDEPFIFTRRWFHADYAAFLLQHGELDKATKLSEIVRPEEHHELIEKDDLYSAVSNANEIGWTAVIDLANGRSAVGRAEMKTALDSYRRLHQQVPDLMWTNTGLLQELMMFAELPQLTPSEARPMFVEAAGIAHGYAVTHPEVLSAQMVEGRAHLGLAKLAQKEHDMTTQQVEAAIAVKLLEPVTAVRPTYKELQDLTASARALR
jgi:hypothetical protein